MDTATTNDRTPAAETREKIAQDLRTLMSDAEELWRITKDDLGERTKQARERLRETLDRAKVSAQELESRAAAGVRATDKVIREHPYGAMGVALGVGLLVGLLVNRR
jgi:ElaB/YqjD/DUF883 family membrane-anchored ribosome-binding protein